MKTFQFNFDDNHILPTVRIQKVVLNHCKSVKHGELVFNAGRFPEKYEDRADIIGIYGQNGSGKSSMIQALSLLKYVVTGDNIPAKYAECIEIGAEFAELEFTFDFHYPDVDRSRRTVIYSFKIEAIPNDPESEDYSLGLVSKYYPYKVRVFDETIAASGIFDGTQQKKQVILTSKADAYPIGPGRKLSFYVKKNKDKAAFDLAVSKKIAAYHSTSFLFRDETLEVFQKYSESSDYFLLMMELRYFVRWYLYIVNGRIGGSNGVLMPIYTRFGAIKIKLLESQTVRVEEFKFLSDSIESINTVLPTLIPDLTIKFKYEKVNNRRGEEEYEIDLFTLRSGMKIPLRNESVGILQIISILPLVISVFQEKSLTFAVDEFDAGVYEYLLGEILDAMEIYGKGQFLFTSHNLRPLEIISKESLVFTTTNPENRYIRLKGIGQTNNLRLQYFNEIVNPGQDEQLYKAEKRHRMIHAFLEAGEMLGKK